MTYIRFCLFLLLSLSLITSCEEETSVESQLEYNTKVFNTCADYLMRISEARMTVDFPDAKNPYPQTKVCYSILVQKYKDVVLCIDQLLSELASSEAPISMSSVETLQSKQKLYYNYIGSILGQTPSGTPRDVPVYYNIPEVDSSYFVNNDKSSRLNASYYLLAIKCSNAIAFNYMIAFFINR